MCWLPAHYPTTRCTRNIEGDKGTAYIDRKLAAGESGDLLKAVSLVKDKNFISDRLSSFTRVDVAVLITGYWTVLDSINLGDREHSSLD